MSKNGKKSVKKSSGKRSRAPISRDVRVNNTRGPTGFPDSEIAIIRYCDEVALNPGAAYGQYTFRGNSCFDPDETGIGHQPLYYDQYAAVYSKYKVISSRCRVTVSNYNASASSCVVLVPSSEILTATSYMIAMEQPYAKRTELLPISTRAGVQSSISSAISTEKVIGLSKMQLASEDYSALTGATPASVWYWNIAAFDVAAVSVRMLVDIEYRVVFYDRRAINPSYTALKISKSLEEQQKRKPKDDMPPVTNLVTPISPIVLSPPPGPSPSACQPNWRSTVFSPSRAGGGF